MGLQVLLTKQSFPTKEKEHKNSLFQTPAISYTFFDMQNTFPTSFQLPMYPNRIPMTPPPSSNSRSFTPFNSFSFSPRFATDGSTVLKHSKRAGDCSLGSK